MRLSHLEKRLTVAAGIIACLFGALAGYGTLSRALEDQFHGGVLDEDRITVLWQNAWATLTASVEVAALVWAVLGVAAVGSCRLLSRSTR